VQVGIVAYELEGESTGVGRYLAGLLSGVRAVAPPGWRFRLFFHRSVPTHEILEHPAFETMPAPAGAFASSVLFEQLQLPSMVRAAGVDVLFSPGYSLPPHTRVPGVVTIHDLSFERLGGEFGWRERWRRRILARRAVRSGKRVLVDTEMMRDEVCARYDLPIERVGVVPLAVESRFGPGSEPGDVQVLARVGVGPPYLLFVGALLERRSPELMVEVLERLLEDDPELRLVVAGPDRLRDPARFDRLCRQHGVSGRVVRLGWVADEALPALYRHAAATLYLSRYEGFGLPPLEGLACGTPAVVGSGLGLDEIWPDYPFRVTALAPDPVVAACRSALWCDRSDFARAASERLAGSSWKRSAELWISELERARW
jgi:glycosyltransferase involved in cell wall biosynthesis